MSTFQSEKRVADVIDYYIDCADEFALTDPPDQINTVTWVVESGDIVVDDDRIEGTDQAIVRISAGTKLYTWHSIRATITCVSGQIYTPLIEIQLVQ